MLDVAAADAEPLQGRGSAQQTSPGHRHTEQTDKVQSVQQHAELYRHVAEQLQQAALSRIASLTNIVRNSIQQSQKEAGLLPALDDTISAFPHQLEQAELRQQ